MHALLSPSGASRWLACTPSARMEEQFPDTAGPAAAEGTLAHKLGELILREKLGLITKQKYSVEFKQIAKDSLYSNDMLSYAGDYAVFVLERFYEAQAHTKDALIFLEQKLNLTDYVPEGFGTGDTVIIANKTLDIIDLKYGKGVLVSAHENKQMMLYALGGLREFDYIYDIDTVRMTIYQPRMDNFSCYEMKVEDLKAWAENVLRSAAEKAFNGEGEFVPGPQCLFCKANAVCKARADKNLEIAKYDFKRDVLLTEAEVADILDRAKELVKWVGDVSGYALEQARKGIKYPGYKLVAGRSNRVITDAEKAANLLLAEGFNETQIYNKKLVGITDLEALLGKDTLGEKLGSLIVKPEGAPTLVPVSDKRAELNSIDAAQKDFA